MRQPPEKEEAGRFWASPGPDACRHSRLARVDVNGSIGFAQWKPAEDGSGHHAWAVHVMEVVDGRIARIDYFLDTPTVFPLFGLPLTWPGD